MIRILSSLVAVITAASINAQTSVHDVPKLVIGITVDQLRGDYLDVFGHTFTEGGFKRLINEGLVYQNIKFDYPYLDDASAIATIYTGAMPFYHGITGNTQYIPEKQQIKSTFTDDIYLGYYTQDKVSPQPIRVSTITDELKVASAGNADVYAFAPQMAQAIVSGGKKANNAFWIDDYSGKWASTKYFKSFYWSVEQENKSITDYSVKAWGMQWSPLLKTSEYRAFPYTQSRTGFLHSLGADKNTYKLFKKTPFVNESVVSMALKVLNKAELGKRVQPDFLALSFYLGNYPDVENYSLEIQDSYARLDRDIEKLLNEVDKTVGLQNTLIFLTSTGYYEANDTSLSEKQEDNNNIFYINRCEALLNMYLMAIYGRDSQWVDKFYNGQIYLNRKLVKEKGLSLLEVQQKAAEFVSEFSGVQEVYTSYQIQHGEWNPVMEYYKNGYSKDSSGDLFVEIQPGYKIANEKDASFETKIVRNNAIVSPVIFFGAGVKPEKIKRTIKATEIAPSVSYIMRIRSPNAAKDQVLPELCQ